MSQSESKMAPAVVSMVRALVTLMTLMITLPPGYSFQAPGDGLSRDSKFNKVSILSALSAYRSRVYVCLSVDRRLQRWLVGLLLGALRRAGDIDRLLRARCVLRRRRSAANAGSVMLRADEGCSMETRSQRTTAIHI